MILVTLVDFVSKEKKFNICWGYNRIDDPLKIPHIGIPFIMLGRQQCQCHQGNDIYHKKKGNYKEKRTQNLVLTIYLQNTENWYRIQKKGCLVAFNTKKLFTFPKYKIRRDTRYNRDKAAKSVKKILSSLEQPKGQREKVLDEEYHLSCLIQFPKSKHCYNNTGKAAMIAESLDARATDFIEKLIRSGCRRVKELESRAMDFVTDSSMFLGYLTHFFAYTLIQTEKNIFHK